MNVASLVEKRYVSRIKKKYRETNKSQIELLCLVRIATTDI